MVKTLATIAVGNDGELEGQARIQPPADLVNALTVGAKVQRWHIYGRSPGVKA